MTMTRSGGFVIYTHSVKYGWVMLIARLCKIGHRMFTHTYGIMHHNITMTFQRWITAACMLCVLVVGNVNAASFAKVNGVEIPQSRLDFIVKAHVSQGRPDTPEVRRAFRDDLIAEEIIAQEALRKGLDLDPGMRDDLIAKGIVAQDALRKGLVRDPKIITQLEIARQTALVRAYQIDYIKTHPVSYEALRKEFEMLKTQMGDKEYKVRHVLIATEAEAKDIIARIKKGAKIDKIAQEESTDTGSKSKGGELDWSPAGNYVAPFAEALTKLNKGQLTEQPVQTPFGWHVIRLDDVRPLKIPPFEEIKNNLTQRVLQRQFEGAVNELRAKAKVE